MTAYQTAPGVNIVVYRVTGRQGFINVPHRYCEECDLAVRVVSDIVDEHETAREAIHAARDTHPKRRASGGHAATP